MQGLAAMETKKQTFTWKKPSTFIPIRRSVSGMKSLLPLKLLSPTLPVLPSWASPLSSSESAFGSPRESTYTQQPRLEKKPYQQGEISSSDRSVQLQNRDIPVYSARGSPLPGLTFYDDGESRSSSSAGSLFSRTVPREETNVNVDTEAGVYEDQFDHLRIAERPEVQLQNWDLISETDGYQSLQKSTKSRRQYSNMSFQCPGEKLFINEGAWLSSAWESPSKRTSQLKISHKRKKFSVESWLSDASTWSYAGENLEYATALSPAKANVVDVNQNLPIKSSIIYKLVEKPSITPTVRQNHEEPLLNTPADSREYKYNNIQREPSHPPKLRFGLDLPACHFTTIVPNPLVSPQRLASVSEHPLQYLKQRVTHDFYHKPPIYQSSSHQRSTTQNEKSSVPSIMSSLEDAISRFPNDILLVDDPLISDIRSRLSSSPSALSSQEKYDARHPLRSPIAPRSGFPPRTSSRNSSRILHPTTSPTSLRASACTQCKEIHAPQNRPPSFHLNTQSLRRIFPHSSEFMRSALYVYVLIHTFVTSLPRPAPPRTSSLHGSQAPNHFTQLPPKAVALLGLPQNANELGLITRQDEVVSRRRIQDLSKRIRKCIYTLISIMDSNCDAASDGLENLDLEFPSTLIRSLEEIVRNCEGRLSG